MSAPSPTAILRQRLREALTQQDRSVLVIAGSGVSIQATGNAPAASWGGLLRLGLARCQQLASGWKKKRFDSSAVEAQLMSQSVADWVSAATVIESTLRGAGGAVYKTWLAETVGALRPAQPEILHALGVLGVPVATTNYDGLLEYALGLQPMTWRTHGLVDQLIAGRYPGDAVLHLHGHYTEDQSVVLGASSYAKVLGDKRTQDLLRDLMRNRDLIFVGMGGGLADPNFSALLDWARDVTLPDARYHFLLVREQDAAELRSRLSLTLRIHVVVYGREYADLAPFLHSLVSGVDPGSRGLPGWLPATAPVSVPITRNLVRRTLFEALRSDSDFSAFCLDAFAETYRLFSDGMDRQRKITLLLERESPEDVLAQLRAYFQPRAPDTHRPPPKSPQLATQEIWRALLRLDRDKQWGDFLASFKDTAHFNQLVLLHGHKDQNVPLFVRRIEQHLADKESCLVVQVPLKLGTRTAKTGANWGLHLRQVITDRIGTAQETPAELLSRATAESSLVIVLVALDNPLHLISALSGEQQQGLQQLLETVLPAALDSCRRVTVLLPLEFADAAQSLLPWAREIAKNRWDTAPLCHIELDELKLPSWADVEKYLRRYPERLPDLPALLSTVKRLYEELCRPGITFERLAQEIDNAILLHG